MLLAASSLYTGNIRINGYYLKYKCIHHYEVAGTSGHYKQMKDLMASEIFVLIVKDWKLQSIDHAANGVDDTRDGRDRPQQITQYSIFWSGVSVNWLDIVCI